MRKGYFSIIGMLIAVGIILFLVTMYFTGSDEPQPVPQNSGNTAPAVQAAPVPRGPAGAIAAAENAKLKIYLVEIRQSIDAFTALQGRQPQSLEEVEKEIGFTRKKLPKGYTYSFNPQTGEVVIMHNGRVVQR